MCLLGNNSSFVITENKRHKFLLLKLIGIITLLILTSFNVIYGLSLNNSSASKENKKSNENILISDISFLISENVTSKLSKSKLLRSLILNFTYFVFNSYIILFCYIWVKYSKTWRAILALILYLILRTILMTLVNFKEYPSKMHDHSFLIPLFTAFSSLHFNLNLSLAFLTIIILELKRMQNEYFVIFGYFTLVLLSIKNILFRDENTADIIIAILISHYLFLLCDIYSFYIDNTFLRLEDEVLFSLEEEYLI